MGEAMPVRVPLRHNRLLSRQPYIELDGSFLQLRLPAVFGRRQVWNLNIADVAVVDTKGVNNDDSGNDWAFERRLKIPYAVTTHSGAAPNLVLLFKTPQRIPPLRIGGGEAIGLPYFKSRTETGVQIDGLRLRARDPVAAVQILADTGVELVDRPAAWMRRHRPVTQDPALLQVARANTRRLRWVTAILAVFAIGLAGLRIFVGDRNPSNWELGALGFALLVIFGLPAWAMRRADRPLETRRKG